MKKFYITKKSIINFITNECKRLKIDKKYMLTEAYNVLIELEKFPNDNKAQIRFYKKVIIELKKI